jgi:hypothetical protein
MANIDAADPTTGADPASSSDNSDSAALAQAFASTVGKFMFEIMQPAINDTLAAVREEDDS